MADKKKELADKLEALRGEREKLRQEKEALLRELESKNAALNGLEQALTNKESEVITLKEAVVESDRKLSEINQTLSQAVASYKNLVVTANPEIPSELITGETIEVVNESLEKARALVERVKQGLEEEASKIRVPVGAPQRVPPDLSVLTPREKIQYAIGGNK